MPLPTAISRRHLLCVLFARRAFARDDQGTIFTTDVNVVNLFATVRTKQGQIVRDLTRDDFVLSEDGHEQSIRYFARQSDLALTLGLLVDTSGSQRRLIGAETAATHRFFEQVLREDKDMAFLIHFDREVELLQDLTSSEKKLDTSLDNMDSPAPQPQRRQPAGGYPGGRRGQRAGGTMLYDAVLLSSDELMRKQAGRKAVILLSDGVDTGSKVSITSAIEAAQRADTMVYSILFSDPDAYGRGNFGGYGRGRMGRRGGGPPGARMNLPDGKKVLQRLAKETGGGFFEVSKKQPLEKVFDYIQEELRNQYSLGYTPEGSTGPGYRTIHLAMKQKGLVVQTRDGYYATK